MADWFGSQALQTDELWSPSRAACSGVGESGSILQVALNWQPHIMQKSFISQTVWANKMNSLWLPPACDARNIVSSAQMEKSLLGTANKESRDTDLPGQCESLWPCLTKRIVKITDWQCGSHADADAWRLLYCERQWWEAPTYELHYSAFIA